MLMKLEENMIIQSSGSDPKFVEFDNWLEKLVARKLDTYQESDYMTMPDPLSANIGKGKESSCPDDAIEFTFGDIETQSVLSQWAEVISKRATLGHTNNVVNQINFECLNQLPGASIVLRTVSRTEQVDDAPLSIPLSI